jgi:hypothetical protein
MTFFLLDLTKFLPPSCDAADDYHDWTIASRNCCLHFKLAHGTKFWSADETQRSLLICHHRLLTGMLPVGRQRRSINLLPFKRFSTEALAWPSVGQQHEEPMRAHDPLWPGFCERFLLSAYRSANTYPPHADTRSKSSA